MNASEFVARYIDAWNRQDAQAVASHLTETGTYLDITVHQEMTREELLAHLEAVFSLETYRYELVGEVCAGNTTIAFQYRALPRQGDQQQNNWLGAEFITLERDAATEIVDYYEQQGAESPQSPMIGGTRARRVQRYAKSGLSRPQMEALKARLTALMQQEKVFLRQDLALPELAELLGCSVNHLSQVINAGFGQSFFDYINHYRIAEAKRLLRSDAAEQPTVLEVALQVGFNSTSTFYVAFRKATGETPARFRRVARR